MNAIKSALFAVSVVVCCLIGTEALAGETVDVSIVMPEDVPAVACPAPVWKDMDVVWGGVKDMRDAQEVGQQTQKGKEPILLMARPPIEQAFDSALKRLLPACGMNFVKGGSEDDYEGDTRLSAEVREFYVGADKKLFTGESVARSGIAFMIRKGGYTSTVTVGYEITSKRLRSGSTKQILKALNELFLDTLKQIPATKEMRDI